MSELREQLAEDFKELVDRAVAPVLAERKRGHFTIYADSTVEAKLAIRYGSDTISFARHLGKTSILGIQGFGFIPTHSIEVVGRNDFFGTTNTQTMFGLRQDGQLVRSHYINPATFGANVVRELDVYETGAIIDYASAPHLHDDSRAFAMQLTDEEKATVEEKLARGRAADEELERNLEQIRESERRAWERSTNIWIR